MPFYEYECSNCKYYTEVLQKLSDSPLRKCPSCGKNAFKKLVSAPVFRLKGSGWYETDFKGDKDNKRNLAGAERDEPKAAEDKKDAKGGEPAKADAAKAAPEKSADGKSGDGKSGDGKSGDGKSGDGKSGDGKSGDGKASGDKRSAAAKPAARSRRAAPAPKAKAAARPAKKKTRR